MRQHNLIDNENFKFYKKDSSGDMVPVTSKEKNEKAKKKLSEFEEKYWDDIPKKYRDNWEKVGLYHPKGNVEKAHSIVLNPENGAYDLRNRLNDLTGKEWVRFTKSWFIFDALQKDLKEERELLDNSEDHPATFSPSMIENFVRFFTQEEQNVLDPFVGIGSTLVACKRSNRKGYGMELNEKYYEDSLKRTPEFKDDVYNADARRVKELFNGKKFHYSISSPPYWSMLNRSTKSFENERREKNLDTNYSDSPVDLGNIEDYNEFIEELAKIYFDIYDLLAEGRYLTVIVKNVKIEGELYPLAWDLAKKLSEKYVLKDEKIWCQDEVNLAPYGYPYSWVSNIIHHYCLNFRKEG